MRKYLAIAIAVSVLLVISAVSAAETPDINAFVGDWAGHSGDIRLFFTVNADGTGRYTFVQSGYTESYDVILSATSGTFTVDIPEDNRLGIAACQGTYQYAGGILALDVRTTFKSGRAFQYGIPCHRVENGSIVLTTAEGVPVTLTLLPGEAFADQADDVLVHTRVGSTVHHSGSQFAAGSAMRLGNMRNTQQYGMPRAAFLHDSSHGIDALADALGAIAQTTALSLHGERYPVQVAWFTAEMGCFIFDCPDWDETPLRFTETDGALTIIAEQ